MSFNILISSERDVIFNSLIPAKGLSPIPITDLGIVISIMFISLKAPPLIYFTPSGMFTVSLFPKYRISVSLSADKK